MKFLDDPSHVMDVAPFVIPPLIFITKKFGTSSTDTLFPVEIPVKDASRPINDQQNQIQLRDRLLSPVLIDKEAQFSIISRMKNTETKMF